ncbi:MAG TPA: hypothetical protein VK435_07460 [Thermodesulfovibrionales bacterium]|nr:hypothetical protein [Thermodesulfovibrionales bacterium]
MSNGKFERLTRRGIISARVLRESLEEARTSGEYIEELLLKKGVPRHEILFCLSEYYGYPFAEFDEDIQISRAKPDWPDLEGFKTALWVPVATSQGKTAIIAYDPSSAQFPQDIGKAVDMGEIEFRVALPSDIIRIIENNQDINPHFPASSGRTQLAKVRTFLAYRRSQFASYRTSLSKGRTGLGFLRTGLSLIAISILLFRVFGPGYRAIVDLVLLAAGLVMTVDGFMWYLPSRKIGRIRLSKICTTSTCDTTVLEVSEPEGRFSFTRTHSVPGADSLRSKWRDLSPVMRRRFLANDRTDLAEERTLLSFYRTLMSKARTGLAFTRTGIGFIGLGIALLRQFHGGSWDIFSYGLVIAGSVMVLEGLYWYVPGRQAGKESLDSVAAASEKTSIWDNILPPVHKEPEGRSFIAGPLPIKAGHAPGIWGTTGLALERTVLAERRNVMSRLRTIMARSRTGLSFVRTGMNFSAVGTGLLVYFGAGNIAWTVAESAILLIGLALIADGLYWHIPAEKIRRQLPYCFGELEIAIPDYGRPSRLWGKVSFSDDIE